MWILFDELMEDKNVIIRGGLRVENSLHCKKKTNQQRNCRSNELMNGATLIVATRFLSPVCVFYDANDNKSSPHDDMYEFAAR